VSGDLLYLCALSAAEEVHVPEKVAVEFATKAREWGKDHSIWPKGFM